MRTGVFRRNLFVAMMPIALVLPSGQTHSALQSASDDSAIRARVPDVHGPETARSAYGFVNSIGLNTHLNYFDRTYGNFDLVERELLSIGIRHLRDGIHLQDPGYNKLLYGRWIELGKAGIRFDAVLDPRSKLGQLTPQLIAQVEDLSGHTIESFEGPNELDISGDPGWLARDRSYQEEILSAVNALGDASRPQVIGPSLALASHGAESDLPLEGFDEGNLHPYPAGKMPSVVFPKQTVLAKHIFGGKPIVFTETGYHNALNDHSDQPAVSEEAAAKYIPRLFLENFARGIPRTYLYEFLDEAPDPGLKDNQLHWGLVRANGTEKPAFIALKRLIELLNNNCEPSSPRQLSWSMSKAEPSIHHLLLQKADGDFDLILWNELPSYDTRQQQDIVNVPAKTLLTLGKSAKTIRLYEPVLQSAPIASYANTASVSLAIPDHPLVVSISFR